MCKINKENHFTGSFCAMLLQSTKGEPVYFEATKNSRQFSLETNHGGFNVYVRYSTRLKNTMKNVANESRKKMFCRFNFTADYGYLQNGFRIGNKTNLVCLVCTNKELNETRLVLMEYEDIMKCLQHTTGKGQRIITVTRQGNSHYYYCYSVESRSKFKCPVDFTKVLGM
jgi:hypothetical protein